MHSWTLVDVTALQILFDFCARLIEKRSILDISGCCPDFLFYVICVVFVFFHLLYDMLACAIFSTAIIILWCFFTSLCQSIVLLSPMPFYSIWAQEWAPGRQAALLIAVWYILHDHAQDPYEKEAAVQTIQVVHISSSCSELLLANKPASCLFLVFIAT